MRWSLLFLLLAVIRCAYGQVHTEYDKNRDFSVYRRFRIGDGEVITPRERQKTDESRLHEWMKLAIIGKLKEKGLLEADSAADLVITYLIGSKEQNEKIDLGMQIVGGVSGNTLATDPSQPNRTWTRDYSLGKIIIDMSDRSGNLVWRISATTEGQDADHKEVIDEVVRIGFKKLSTKPRKGKR